MQLNQHWGTPNPITIRDKEFGMVRLRAFGIYAYHVADPKIFYEKISGTRDTYRVEDLEGQLRENIISQMTSVFANSQVSFLDMAANQVAMANTLKEQVGTMFGGLGLALDNFAVENISLPDELQKILDQRIEMNMLGNLDQYTKFQAAQSIQTAAANPGGIAGIGVGAGVGLGMGQIMADALRPGQQAPAAAAPPPPAAAAPAAAGAAADTKFCMECGNSMPRAGRFCPSCGKPQG
jgi:membrane protease subunit (stomatin/prohibitin family)